jgi:sterol desaturase/sphingolipid hydroxylase (fatty acid hydroxylase superfamily)
MTITTIVNCLAFYYYKPLIGRLLIILDFAVAASGTHLVVRIGLLLLDLIGAYLVHLVEHKTKVLWRFHLIHHTDTWIDTTTANRHHPEKVLFGLRLPR